MRYAIGLVGLGVISRFYLAALRTLPHARLAAVCDADENALAPFRAAVGTYRDHRDLLESERLDALIVAAPNDAHATICRDALDAGVAVCVEKPLAMRADEGGALVAHAAATGVPLFTAFHRRYNVAVRRLREWLPAGVPIESVAVRYLERIEDHVGTDAWYLDPSRCGGGCLADNGPNALDLARTFCGDVEVRAAELSSDASGVDRRARMLLTAPSGAMIDIMLDWSYPGECKDIEIRLATGACHRADLLAGHHGFKASLWHEYEALLADFVDTCLTGSVPTGTVPVDRTTRDPGLCALALVDAGYRAANRTRTAVRIP